MRKNLINIQAAVTLLLFTAAARADLSVSNRVITTPRHIFTADDTGLPAQLVIQPATNDIPLVWRAEKQKPDDLLRRIGRGPQFAAPMRIEAVVDKLTVVAKADAPVELKQTDKGVEAEGAWQADKLKGSLRLVYAVDGSMTGEVTYEAKGVDLERLDLVLELGGLVDTAIAGNPVAAVADKALLPVSFGTLGSTAGIVWSDGANPAGDGGRQKGQIGHFFLGNGDRGFTWLAHGQDGFSIGGNEPSMTVERKREGTVVWKIALVNRSPGGGANKASFTLLTHPAGVKAGTRRLEQWQPWGGNAATPELTVAARSAAAGSNVMVRADAGSVCETVASRALLEGLAGGVALDPSATLADRFPLGLFRYLAAPHTALSAQLRPNAAMLTSSGASPGLDRVALGRALLHDIGVDVSGLARRMEAANVLCALDRFGYFEGDGQTEFLPYWRTDGIFQLGETFEGDAGFAVTKENPTARTKVSAFIRPTAAELVKNRPVIRRKTLFVLVNEGTNAVREYLYIWNPNYLFGGFNRLQAEQIYSQLDFSGIAPDGDWQRNRVERTLPELIKSRAGRGSGLTKSNGAISRNHMSELMDIESGGIVRMAEREIQFAKKFYGDNFVKNGFQLYGPVYIPPRGMRLLLGEGLVELPHGVAGRVVDKKTGKPLSVPVHIVLRGEVKPSDTVESMKSGKNQIATVQSDKDGYFRYQGFARGMIFAEVNGKLLPPRPQVRIRNDGVVEGSYDAPDAGGVEGGSWPTISVYQHWPNPNADSAGKWVDVLIEADAPTTP